MQALYSVFFMSFFLVSLLLTMFSMLMLFFESKFIGMAQKSLGMSFLGSNGWLHLPADIMKFWSKNSFKNSSLWIFSSFNLFIMLSLYYLWNLISLVFFTNNQGFLNYDFSSFQMLLYLTYANLTTLYLFFIIVNLKSKYAVIGGASIILVNIFLEFSFMLNFYTLYIYTGGFSFDDFSYSNSWSSFMFSLPISSLIFMMYSMYEAKRAPFDHAEAESELVAGHIVEFSGKSLLFFFFSEYLHLYFCIYLMILFSFGNWETMTFMQMLMAIGEPLYMTNTLFLNPVLKDMDLNYIQNYFL